jgi:adenylate cyclase
VSQWTDQPSRSLDLAYEAATRSAALDPKLPAAYWALIFANLWMRRYDDAIRAGESAIANNPTDAEAANGLGAVLHYSGRSEDALRYFERAMALNPLCPGMWLHFQGQAYY